MIKWVWSIQHCKGIFYFTKSKRNWQHLVYFFCPLDKKLTDGVEPWGCCLYTHSWGLIGHNTGRDRWQSHLLPRIMLTSGVLASLRLFGVDSIYPVSILKKSWGSGHPTSNVIKLAIWKTNQMYMYIICNPHFKNQGITLISLVQHTVKWNVIVWNKLQKMQKVQFFGVGPITCRYLKLILE